MKRPWNVNTPAPRTVDRLATAADVDPVTAAVLVNRGITSTSTAADFLAPSFHGIRPPQAVKDLHVAAHRIAEALERRERILVFGDYDVDGVTATVLLVEFLRQAGGVVDYYIPHRMIEGYGLQPGHIHRVAIERQVRLLITVDCGITSFEAVECASQAGVDVIITDHHIPSDRLPDALAVVNPKRADCDACLDHLAGVGMAFYLLILLRKRLRDSGHWDHRVEPNLRQACDLVALGTVADMVPLLGENRAFTRAGLDVLTRGQRPGIRALATVSRLGTPTVEADDIAFRLAPRINAAGRLDHAGVAAELLLTKDPEMAASLASRLDRFNSDRQEIEQQILEAIDRTLASSPGSLDRRVIVLADPAWHEGVLGIAASRTARRYGRPTVLFALRDGIAKGSARSVSGLDLFRTLEACRSDILTFGGHAMAAGLKVNAADLDRFRDRFESEVAERLPDGPVLEPLEIDAEVDLSAVDQRMMDNFERLKPFGNGNPEPLLMATDLVAEATRIVGDRHRKFVLRQNGANPAARIPAIEFNSGPDVALPERLARIAFHLRWNHWNGNRTLQAVVCGIDLA